MRNEEIPSKSISAMQACLKAIPLFLAGLSKRDLSIILDEVFPLTLLLETR